MLSAKSFSPLKFNHVADKENSMYFIINKDSKLTIDKINARVNEYDLLIED